MNWINARIGTQVTMMNVKLPATGRPPDDDPRRLQAALGYLFTPVVPLLNLSNSDPDDNWTRRQARQAMYWSGPFFLLLIASIGGLVALMALNFLFVCLMPVVILVPFVPGAIWARRVYLGDEVSIPVIRNLLGR